MSTNPTPLLTITPVKPSDIPSEESLIAEGTKLIEAADSWKTGKKFYEVVQSSSRPKLPGDGAPWHCRTSEHKTDEITFDELWDKLANNKPENEMQFIHEIKKVTKVKELSSSAKIWTFYYTFVPPVSPRVFTVLQVAHLSETTPRSGLIVSIPIDLTSDEELFKFEEKGTKGRYVSVERLLELENGTVQWRMATSSTPGGSIPNFIAEGTMDKKIASDVPHFMKWFKHSKK